MSEEERRYNALTIALDLAKTVGLSCPACVTNMAAAFAAYLKDGTVSDEHQSDVSDEDDDIVFTLEGEKLN